MLGDLLYQLRRVAEHPFNRGRPLKAMARYLRWQVSSRLALGPVAVEIIDGVSMLLRPGAAGGTSNIYFGLAEFDDMAFALHLLRPGDLFFDIGANLGAYSLLACATGATVAAYEPAPRLREELNVNIRMNAFAAQTTVRPVAVAGAAGTVRLALPGDGRAPTTHIAADHAPHEGTIEVEAVTIDAEMARFARAPRLIKIDIEGHELPALLAASAALAAPDLWGVIIEFTDQGKAYGYSDAALHELLVAAGLAPFVYDGFTRTLSPLDVSAHAEQNRLYLRNLNEVEARLKSAPAYKVQGQMI